MNNKTMHDLVGGAAWKSDDAIAAANMYGSRRMAERRWRCQQRDDATTAGLLSLGQRGE